MMAAVLTWASLCLWCFVARAGLRARLYAFFVITVAVILAAPSDHDNYVLWWTPVLVILLGTLGAQPLPDRMLACDPKRIHTRHAGS